MSTVDESGGSRERSQTIPTEVRSSGRQTALGQELAELNLSRLVGCLVVRHGFEEMEDLVQHYQDRGFDGLKGLLLAHGEEELPEEDNLAIAKIRLQLDALITLDEQKNGATTNTVARRRGVSPEEQAVANNESISKREFSPSVDEMKEEEEALMSTTRKSGTRELSAVHRRGDSHSYMSGRAASLGTTPNHSAMRTRERSRSDLPNFSSGGNGASSSSQSSPPSKLSMTRELNKEIHHYWKIVVVGAPHAGKSCFIQRVVGGKYNAQYTRTMGVDYRKWHMLYNTGQGAKVNIEINFWDVAGQRNGTFQQMALNGLKGVIFLYDTSQPESLETTLEMRNASRSRIPIQVPCILLGSKNDLPNSEQFPWESERRQQVENDYAFMGSSRCSAKTGDGVMEAVEGLAQLIYREFVVESRETSRGVSAAGGAASATASANPTIQTIVVKPVKRKKKKSLSC